MKKVVLSLFIGTLLVSNISIVFAKDLDIKDKKINVIKPLLEIMNAGKILEVYNNKSNFLIEVEGKFYDVTKVDVATKDGTPIKDAVKNLEAIEDSPGSEDSEEFEVKDIY